MSVRASTWAWERIREHELRGTVALVLLRVADHADSDGRCWPGAEGLAPYCGDESTVRRALKQLEAMPLLMRSARRRESGRGRGTDLIQLLMPPARHDQPGTSPGESSPPEAPPGNPAPRAGSDDQPGTENDQPGTSPGESSDDQPGAQVRPTGRSGHDQPGTQVRPNTENRQGTVREPCPPSPSARGDAAISPGGDSEDFPPDVVRLCDLHCQLVNARTNRRKPYAVTGEWLEAMDRLVRIDGRSPAEIEHVIRWIDRDDFERSNVLSVPKLRKRFDELLLKSQRGGALARSAGPVGSVDRGPRGWLQRNTPELLEANENMARRALTVAQRSQPSDAGDPTAEKVRAAFVMLDRQSRGVAAA